MLEPSDLDRNFTIALANTLGHAVLIETFRQAVYYVHHSNGTAFKSRAWKRGITYDARSCFLFIQGTGLNVLLDYYDLNYNPDYLRSSFNYCVRHS